MVSVLKLNKRFEPGKGKEVKDALMQMFSNPPFNEPRRIQWDKKRELAFNLLDKSELVLVISKLKQLGFSEKDFEFTYIEYPQKAA